MAKVLVRKEEGLEVKLLLPVEKFRQFLDVNGLDCYEGCPIEVAYVGDADWVEYCTEDEALKVLGYWSGLLESLKEYCEGKAKWVQEGKRLPNELI